MTQETLKQVLMRRDDLSEEEADELIAAARERVLEEGRSRGSHRRGIQPRAGLSV